MPSQSATPLEALAADLGNRALTGWRLTATALAILLRGETRAAIVYIRLAQHFQRRGWRPLARLMSIGLRRRFGCMVSLNATIGPGFSLPYPIGVVIGAGVKIGANCTVHQHVTLGGARMGDWKAGHYPDIGDNVVLFAGAKIVGALTVGDNAVIGANAVVRGSVPADHIAVGIPAIAKAPKEAGSPAFV